LSILRKSKFSTKYILQKKFARWEGFVNLLGMFVKFKGFQAATLGELESQLGVFFSATSAHKYISHSVSITGHYGNTGQTLVAMAAYEETSEDLRR